MEEWRVRWKAAQAGDTAAASPIRDSGSMMTYSMADDHQRPVSESSGSSITVSRSRDHFGTTAGITAIEDNFRVDIQSLKKSLPRNAGMLIVTNGPIIGTCFEAFNDLITIGRDPESNIIVLNDPTVSRRHAVIHRYGTAFTVRDVGSRNGTYLHQVKLTTESPLPSNEEIQIGVFRMWFIQGTREQG
jgi:pSer/pThr/pTyr-binding forkhead associated (FHA) protein